MPVYKPTMVFLDFSEAFDSVNHHKLVFKLKLFGITGKLHEWFKDYLFNCFLADHYTWGYLNAFTRSIRSNPRFYSGSHTLPNLHQ